MELKPCPFCGSRTAPKACSIAEAEYIDTDDIWYKWMASHFTVVCNFNDLGCGASVNGKYETIDGAVKAWNRRKEPDNVHT